MKDTYLQIRLSTEVKELLTKQAKNYGMSMSEYVRYLALEDARRNKPQSSSDSS